MAKPFPSEVQESDKICLWSKYQDLQVTDQWVQKLAAVLPPVGDCNLRRLPHRDLLLILPNPSVLLYIIKTKCLGWVTVPSIRASTGRPSPAFPFVCLLFFIPALPWSGFQDHANQDVPGTR